jgi:carbon-monoxide dehydrogenase medium subunit
LQYIQPNTIQEACLLLSRHQQEATLVAGGTDLYVQMKREGRQPKYIVSIANMRGWDHIEYDEKDGLRIGALATIQAVATSPIIREKAAVLAQAASQLGSEQIRNRATIGGNLCNAAPSAETGPALLALDARLKVLSLGRERIIPIESFFTGPGGTVLGINEVLAEIQVPTSRSRSEGVYLKHSIRKSMDLAIVGVAVVATIEGEALINVKIALGAVAPTPIRARKAENILEGKRPDDRVLTAAARVASEESSAITDIRSSSEYREKMVKVLVKRALLQALEQAKLRQRQ